MAGAVRSKATLADFLAIPEESRFHEPFDAMELAVVKRLGGE
jgi:hypothetical protein